MGDNIPDFGSMSEEEQMRWLESLASRQGANADEFTTSADMDVPEVDADSVVIDEPGYVPSETFSFSQHAQPAATSVEPEQPVVEMEDLESSDPMAFLESLTAQQEFDTDDLEQAEVVDEEPAPAEVEQPQPSSSSQSMEELAASNPMAFLEALAARQGADSSQFTTSADMDVPEVDADSVVIDEPGYVPSETFSFSQHAQPVAASDEEEATPAPSIEEPTDIIIEEETAPQPQLDEQPADYYVTEPQQQPAEYETQYYQQQDEQPADYDWEQYQRDLQEYYEKYGDQLGEEYDWSQYQEYYQQQGQQPAEYDWSQYQEYYQQQGQQPAEYAEPEEIQQTEQTLSEAETPPVVEETPIAQEEAPSAGMSMEELAASDPMAFMEALAARQGADRSQFVTAGDMEIPEVDPDSVVVDEPGYVPSESLSIFRREEEQKAAAPVEATPPEIEEEPPVMPAAELVDEELTAESDPVRWLESLATRQGVDEAELLTDADVAIPEVDPDTADMSHVGPGYTPYSVHETVPGQPKSPPAEEELPASPEMSEDPVLEMPDMEADASLSWLQDLAADQGAQLTDFLDDFPEDEGLPGFDLDFDTSDEEATAELSAIIDVPTISDDEFHRMTDEEIARAQIEGTISPEQELEWLTRKAEKMSETLDELDEDDLPSSTSTAEAVPGEVPDWLKAQMPEIIEGDADTSETPYPPLIDQITAPPEPDDLPDWLTTSVDGDDSDLDLGELTLEDTSAVEAVVPEELADPAEAEALLEGFDDTSDPWVQAFKDEAELEEWYDQAIAEVDTEEAEEETELAEELEAIEPEVVTDTTDWLSQEPAEEPEAEGDMPDWLRISLGEGTSDDISEWLRGTQVGEEDWDTSVSGADEAVSDDWLTSAPATDDDALAAAGDVEDWMLAGDILEDEPVATDDWLQEPVGVGEQPATVVQPQERLPQGVEGSLPPWYAAATTQPAPSPPVEAPRPAAPPPPPPRAVPPSQPASPPPAPAAQPSSQQQPVPPPTEPAPVPETYAEYRQKLEQQPDDHETRLRLARDLGQQGSVKESLQQYETLIENSAMLEVLAQDLSGLVQRIPQHPRARRLLGDIYMRQGRLQEALDTYRGALDQL